MRDQTGGIWEGVDTGDPVVQLALGIAIVNNGCDQEFEFTKEVWTGLLPPRGSKHTEANWMRGLFDQGGTLKDERQAHFQTTAEKGHDPARHGCGAV